MVFLLLRMASKLNQLSRKIDMSKKDTQWSREDIEQLARFYPRTGALGSMGKLNNKFTRAEVIRKARELGLRAKKKGVVKAPARIDDAQSEKPEVVFPKLEVTEIQVSPIVLTSWRRLYPKYTSLTAEGALKYIHDLVNHSCKKLIVPKVVIHSLWGKEGMSTEGIGFFCQGDPALNPELPVFIAIDGVVTTVIEGCTLRDGYKASIERRDNSIQHVGPDGMSKFFRVKDLVQLPPTITNVNISVGHCTVRVSPEDTIRVAWDTTNT